MPLSLIVGQKYIIERKYDTSRKPPMTIETLVEIIKIDKQKPDIITVKFLSGLLQNINKIKDIKCQNYDFTLWKPLENYKEMEWENLFLKAAIIIIIWMYIKGVIKMA